MILISQHSRLLHLKFPEGTVFRVNAAWIKTRDELFDLLGQLDGEVFLDYPRNRLKLPRPTLPYSILVEAMETFDNVKYFAISNVTNGNSIEEIRNSIPEKVLLVPKIESAEGINNFEDIFGKLKKNEKYVMLDKEDLYSDLGTDDNLFEKYVTTIRDKCKKHSCKLLELMGVIFSDEYP